MSQGNDRQSPRLRGKSPSRIPVFTPTPPKDSGSRKRPAPAPIIDLTDTDDKPKGEVKTPNNALKFKKFQELVKADVRNRNTSPRQVLAAKSGVPWVEKHLPKSVDELFVHKKKVEEVTFWMNRVFTSRDIKRNNICVINGPSGCGKTATVYLLAQQYDAEVKEWSNPMSLTQFKEFRSEDFRDEVQSRSQLDIFTDFLFRTSQYRSLPMKGKPVKKNSIILIEDIPNIFTRDTKTFHEILRKYSETSRTPLVLVFSDTAGSEHSLFRMLPKNVMTDLGICNITMNAVATSLMVKFMLEICSREGVPADRSVVEEVAATANGDLRCAVNNLQFSLTKERCSTTPTSFNFRKPPPKRSRKGNAGGAGTAGPLSGVQQKDDTIQLFRALGKVLYGKRDETTISEVEMELVGELEKERRLHPLLENPENIGDKMEVSSETFLNFLHQNYPPFFGSTDDMRSAAEYLGDGDFILSGWKFDDSGNKSMKVRDVKEQVAMSTAIRGLMHCNINRLSMGWKPLTKPLVSNLENVTRDSVESTRQALFHLRELQTSLFTEAIPFYAKLIKSKPVQLGVGTKEILEKGLFQRKVTRAATLDEKETVGESSSEGDSADPEGNNSEEVNQASKEAASQATVKTSTDLDASLGHEEEDGDNEEFIIEEYD